MNHICTSFRPVTSMTMWVKTYILRIDPPEKKIMPGRPKRCKRKRKDELVDKTGKLSNNAAQMMYRLCGELDHNKRGCPRNVCI